MQWTPVRLKCVFLVLLHLHVGPAAVRGCILLLNGWEPLSLGERAALAPVVAAGYVRQVLPASSWTPPAEESEGAPGNTGGPPGENIAPNTYSAEIALIEIYKGEEVVKNLSGVYFNTC